MNSAIYIAFIVMVIGLWLIFGMTPLVFLEEATKTFRKPDQTIQGKVQAVTSTKKKRGLKKLMDETNIILTATGKEHRLTMMIILSLILMVVGAFFAITMDNLFLLPVLACGFALMPFWYIKFIAIKWKKELNSELETALSIITTSYLRSESIITAIDENIDYINPPVYDVFKAFLMQTKLINSNIKIALSGLKEKVDSPVFHEWLNAVIDCQEDKNLKSTLTPIVSKLSDMRIVSAELDYLLFEPVKEFISMAVLLVGNIPLMYFLNRDWYDTLMTNTLGKVVLAICGTILFVSIAGVVRLSKPIEYRR
jgi:Flp pilus assembly protein TadB